MNENDPMFLTANPPVKQGEPRFEAKFNIDGNKRLLITAWDLKTGGIDMWVLGIEKVTELTPIICDSYYSEHVSSLEKWLRYSRSPEHIQEEILLQLPDTTSSEIRYFVSETVSSADNRYFLYALQKVLAQKISEGCKIIRKGKKLLEEANKLGDTEKSQSINPMLTSNKNIVRIARTIGDGIACRNLRFDRPVLRMLAENNSPGHVDISDKGFRGEDKFAQWLVFNRGSVAIINDLTNILRIGDVTEIGEEILFHELKKGGKEVKNIYTLRPGGRVSTQTVRVLQVQRAASHRKILIGSGEEIQILDIDIPIYHNLDDVSQIIQHARKDGYCFQQIGDYLAVSCTDMEKFAKESRRGEQLIWENRRKAPDWAKNDESVSFSNYDTFYNEGGHFLRNMLPYSVFPFSEHDCMGLLSGKLLLITHLNISAIKCYLRNNGWEILDVDLEELHKKNEQQKGIPSSRLLYSKLIDDTIFVACRGAFSMNVPLTLVDRIGMEFISPKTLLEQLEEIYKKSEPGKDCLLAVHLPQEASIWK